MHDPKLERLDLPLRRQQTELMLAFSNVHQQMLRRTTVRLADAGFAITPGGANALIVLFNARRAINARELAQGLGVSEVTVSRFLSRMVADGWVERTPDPNDGRAQLIRVTEVARKAFPDLVRVCNAVLDDAFAGLDRDALNELSASVAKVQEHLIRAG